MAHPPMDGDAALGSIAPMPRIQSNRPAARTTAPQSPSRPTAAKTPAKTPAAG